MIRNIVVNGGFFKLMALPGCIKYFEEKDMVKNFENYYATSAGCIICLLLILGYKYSELHNFIINFDFKNILEPNIINLANNLCLFNNEKAELFIKGLLKYKNLDENITLKDLYDFTKKKLTVTTTSLTKKNIMYFNYENQPSLPVWRSIMMSSAIPFGFKPVYWNGDLYLDGGLCDNLPVSIVPKDELDKTLCIKTKSKTDNDRIVPEDFKYSSLFEYLYDIMCIYENYDYNYGCSNIISIEIGEKNNIFSGFKVDSTPEEYTKMMDIAYEKTKDFFEKQN